MRGLAIPLEWQRNVIRAAITLKLCQHEETGAIVAALTTSIPEAPGSGRDWGARDAARTSGTNHIRFLTEPQPLRLTTDAPVIHILDGRSFRLEESLHLFLGPDEPFVGNVSETLAVMLHQTADHWQA